MRWAQAQLEDADLQVIAEHAASIITSSLALDNDARAPSEWEYERKIMSQIDHCYDIFQTRLAPKDMNDQTRSIACKLAKVYEYHSNAEKPEVLYRRSLRGAKEGSETLDELRIMNYLGANLTFNADLGRDDHRANPLDWHERAYKGMKKLGLDDNNMDVMETKKHMADFFRRGGEPLKAISLYNEVLGVQETEFGKDDPRTLETRCGLGDSLMAHGQIDEALHQFESVKSIGEVVLRKDHYSTIETIYRIGDIHKRMHEYDEALRYFKMALERLEMIFGADNSHRLTLIVQGGMADVLDFKGHYHEALKAYQKLHDVYKRNSGADGKASIWELRRAVDIGRVLGRMGQYKTALQLLKETAQTMKEKESVELRNYFLTPASILRIGNICENQGRYDKALEAYTWVKDRCHAVWGEGHTTTLLAVCETARVLNRQGKYADALIQYNKAEAGQKKAVGVGHPRTLEAILGMAEVHQNMGQFGQSSALYRTVFFKLKEMETKRDEGVVAESREYGHPMMLMATYGMGRALESEKEYDEALRYYDLVREGWERTLGKGHTLALTAELGCGRIMQKQKRYREAQAIYEGIWLDMTRDDHPLRNEQPLRMEYPLRYETACSKGSALFEMGQYDEAKASYDEALGGLRQILGDDHPTTLGAMQGKAEVLEKQGNYGDSLELYRTVAAGLRDKLGDQHPETIRSRKKVSSAQRRKNFGL